MKTVGSFVGNFALAVVGWALMESIFGAIGALILQALTGTSDGSPLMVAWFVLLGVALGFLCFANAWQDFKARPRGLGQRRVRKWKDGSPYYEWEKY